MAKLTNESLFMVQTGEQFNSIKAVDLKSFYSPLAVQPDASRNRVGIPGIMFPSEQFEYNELTGELSLRGDDNAIREQIGYIGWPQNYGGSIFADGTTDQAGTYNGLEVRSSPVVPAMRGAELPGQYYVVIDPEYKYVTNSWGTGYYDPNNPDPSNINRVFVGDEMVKQQNGDWVVTKNLVSSNVFMLKDLTSYPHISLITENP